MSILQLTQSVFTAMNSRDFTELEQNITDDIAFDFPGAGLIEGKKRVVLFLKALQRKFPQLTFTISEIIPGENRACAVWTNEGVSNEGKPYRNSGITLLHFNAEKITFISDYFKDTSFVRE